MNEITKSDVLYIWLLICGACLNIAALYLGVIWLIHHLSVYWQ